MNPKNGNPGQIVNADEGHQRLSDYIRSINRRQEMSFKPAHKVIAPGQIVNSFDRYPYMKHSTADQTLTDVIRRTNRAQAFDDVANEKNYSKDFPWVAEFIDNKDGVLPLTAHYIQDHLHIQGHGSALILLPSGKWFMEDTSGG
jgi:hypothetical protein